MRAVKRSPLLRIALLSLAVLFVHSTRAANVQHSFPAAPPCPRKVAVAQPDPETKPALASKRIVRRGRRADVQQLFGGVFDLADAHGASFFSPHQAREIDIARRTISFAPQHSSFVLRI